LLVVNLILSVAGLVLVAIGAFCDIAAAIGINRFPNFFVRLHAATVGAIGGGVIPAFGAGLIALGYPQLGTYRYFVAGVAFATGLLIMILGQAGAHALARATLKSKAAPLQPCVHNALEERERREGGGGES